MVKKRSEKIHRRTQRASLVWTGWEIEFSPSVTDKKKNEPVKRQNEIRTLCSQETSQKKLQLIGTYFIFVLDERDNYKKKKPITTYLRLIIPLLVRIHKNVVFHHGRTDQCQINLYFRFSFFDDENSRVFCYFDEIKTLLIAHYTTNRFRKQVQ